jgi:hypothetical protein
MPFRRDSAAFRKVRLALAALAKTVLFAAATPSAEASFLKVTAMQDIILLAIGGAAFALFFAYTFACDHL